MKLECRRKGKRGSGLARWLAGGFVVLLAGAAGAQETQPQQVEVQPPGGARERPEKRYEPAAPGEPEATTALVKGDLAPPTPASGAPDIGAWTDARWLALDGTEARLALADGERRVQVGSLIGGDRVKSVRARQLVLERPARPGQPGGTALVIVDFPGEQARVRVLWSRDPKAVTPPEAP